MNKNAKKIGIIAVVAIVLIAGIFAIVKHTNNSDVTLKTISISVYDKENTNIYKERVDTDKQYLIEVLEENKDLNVVTQDSQYGKFITSIKGIEQGGDYYWMYYIDGEFAQVGVSNCEIEDGKTYDFKIENINQETE